MKVKVLFDTTKHADKVSFFDYLIKYANGNIKIFRSRHFLGNLEYTPNFIQDTVEVFNYEAEEIFKMLSQYIY